MRLAVLSDVHGNLAALEAVLRDMAARGVDGAVHLGDLVGWGADARAVVERVHAEGVPGVAGNWDLAVLCPDPDEAWTRFLAGVAPEAARPVLGRTREELGESHRECLRGFPAQMRIQEGALSLLLAHGSPDSPTEGLSEQTPEARLRELLDRTGVDILLVGHTHRPLARKVGGGLLLNPGSVGRPADGDPRASYLVLDTEGELTIQAVRVEFGVETRRSDGVALPLPCR